MKSYLLFFTLLTTFSCAAQESPTGKSATKKIRVETTYAGNITPGLIATVDSAIQAAVLRFNADKRCLNAVLDTGAADAILQIDFTKTHLVTANQKRAAYFYNSALTGVRIIYFATGWGTPFVFLCLPNHKISSRLTFISNSSGALRKRKKLKVSTGVLFAKSDKQAKKLLHKFSDKLYTELVAFAIRAGSLTTATN